MPLGFAVQGNSAPDPSDIAGAIQAAANRYGVDPAYMMKAATIESGMDPRSVSSTGAKGLFQFTGGTAAQYGLRNPFDPTQNADAAARLTSDNQSKLTQSLGRAPSSGELYLAHQQGAAGASALLNNPSQNVVDALAPVYSGNRTKAVQAVVVNGGSPDQTAGAFANKWTSQFGQPSAGAQQALPGTGAASAQTVSVPPGAVAQNTPLSLSSAGTDAADDAADDAKETQDDYKAATGIGAAISKAFGTGISAPSLMPLSSAPQASAPVIQNSMVPS